MIFLQYYSQCQVSQLPDMNDRLIVGRLYGLAAEEGHMGTGLRGQKVENDSR